MEQPYVYHPDNLSDSAITIDLNPDSPNVTPMDMGSEKEQTSEQAPSAEKDEVGNNGTEGAATAVDLGPSSSLDIAACNYQNSGNEVKKSECLFFIL